MTKGLLMKNDLIGDISSLELYARLLAKGLMIGKHSAAKLSSGMEFSQYRAYCQGDDLRLMDWKMYAKTGKYYIRQSRVETENHMHLHLDNSKSMLYREDGISKLELARILSASLSYIAAQQGDHYNFYSDEDLMFKGRNFKDWRNALIKISEMQINQGSDVKKAYTPSKGIHIWITDLYEDIDAIDLRVKSLVSPMSELIVLHVAGDKEEKLDFSHDATFVDLETNEEVEVDAPKYAKKYEQALSMHFANVKKTILRHQAYYLKIYLGSDLSESIRQLVTRYNQLAIR